MRFEHIIQINSHEIGAPAVLSREQVWRGIALRAYDPAHFIIGLEGHAVRHHERRDDGTEVIERTLHFGVFEVDDKVTLTPMEQIHVEVAATDKWPACTATARIEEPEPSSLFLRFVYEWNDADPAEQALSDDERRMREQALVGLDMDTVSRIRELADSGMQ
ncbi:DUF1857 family protein [Verticiella sediminum]|uniref:DUF1857 family protein n=1 Tax=Verticiella sediminum TaxID=1247510 RepID=A0A556ALW1_9BURK|nr:AtaL-like protein [Verticiella sediminum]TSH93873.1 DUF1857 family protein [Verticiella sediminum]